MENRKFLELVEEVDKDLLHEPVQQAFNSIGSHIFFDFGNLKEIEFPNGKKALKGEWTIWVGIASWRITRNNKYLVGSDESVDISIEHHLQQMLGKRFQSIAFCSQFLDAQLSFENEYQITTFFNWMEEEQWTIFLSDDRDIGVDFCNAQAVRNVKNIASKLPIVAHYEKFDTAIQGRAVTKVTFDGCDLPTLHFGNSFSIHLEACLWRLEKKSNYVIGYLDEHFKKAKSKLVRLIGKKLEQIAIANPMMDAKFQFEDGFVLKTFSCSRVEKQWKIYEFGKLTFCATIPLIEI